MESTALKERLSGQITNRQTEPASKIIPVTAQGADPVAASEYIALTSNALDVISANLKNQQLSPALLDVIKAPSGGVTSFTVPGIGGDVMEKELTGIILDYTTPRAYWDSPDPVEGTPPQCFSTDSITSHEGQPCSQCPYNEFGSKDNGDGLGKACKESVSVFLLQPGKILPIIVRVPVSSKAAYLKYMTRLIANMMPVSGVVTRITLEKATNKTGQPYATYTFEAMKLLSSEESAAARTFGQKFCDMIDTADVDTGIADA